MLPQAASTTAISSLRRLPGGASPGYLIPRRIPPPCFSRPCGKGTSLPLRPCAAHGAPSIAPVPKARGACPSARPLGRQKPPRQRSAASG